MYKSDKELMNKNWSILKESAQIEIVLNILYIGIRLIGTKRMGLLVQRGLKGGAFGQIIYDIKEYINSYNPFVNNQNLVNISEVENKNEYLNNINEINNISEKIGIYSNYIEPYITIENVVYISTFIIISVMTYQLYKYIVDEYNFNNYNNKITDADIYQIDLSDQFNSFSNLKALVIKKLNDKDNVYIDLYKLIQKKVNGNIFLDDYKISKELVDYIKLNYIEEYNKAYNLDCEFLKENNIDKIELTYNLYTDYSNWLLSQVEYIVKIGGSTVIGMLGADIMMGEPAPSDPVLENYNDNIKIERILENSNISMDEFAKLSADEQESLILAFENSLNENNIIKDTGPIIFERFDEYGLPLDMEDSVRNEWLKVFDELGVSNVQEYEEYLNKTQEVVEIINEEKKSIFSGLVDMYKEILKSKK